jgi:pimeloyl-ACP methyl ester carboxylesterase
MTIVLVHGNPETEAIWDDLVPHLRGDDLVRLSPPGFGSAIPSGFDCSSDAYRLARGRRSPSISWGMTGVGGTSCGSQ